MCTQMVAYQAKNVKHSSRKIQKNIFHPKSQTQVVINSLDRKGFQSKAARFVPATDETPGPDRIVKIY